MANYLITWTDIYNSQHSRVFGPFKKTPSEHAAVREIGGDVIKTIDSIDEVMWDDKLNRWAIKPKPFAHSKIPVIEGDNIDFIEYSSELVPEQGDIYDFDTAHNIAVSLLGKYPDTVLLHSNSGNWWLGKMDRVKRAQWRTNYDYPYEGLYTNLDKYKSVADFRKRRRVKRKKDIKNILNTRPDR